MIRVIASDMDGTLLNSQHDITEENVKAILKAKELGVHFIIATGRMYDSVKPFMDKHGIKCEYILMNGAEFRNENGELVESISMDKRKIKDILNILCKEDLIVELYTDEGSYTTSTKEEALKEMVYRVQNFEKVQDYDKALEIAKEHEHFKTLKYIDDIDKFIESRIEIRKIITFSNDVEVINKTKVELNNIGGLAVLSSFITNIEITDERAQKGYILKKVTEKMGIKNEEVIAFGDSFNDYSLFTEFEKAYAMENAIPEIKEIAKNITDTNDNSGVAKAIYKELGI
ncbi:MAG: HAD family phosphatase [Clostridium sp.]|uniref:Phosphatase YwpJ n=1 Tax=Clostridium paraputrificum TaxID=29363 RepID=A0A6N3G6A5_9CLOT|nr:Cof-type HAD-IIB family hydrolase [Clostridium sp.]MBS5926874.1 HAD family phosphatase [Clostridium sp.]MBS5986252.1 HAD family phosphatase [Clostridium sp.]